MLHGKQGGQQIREQDEEGVEQAGIGGIVGCLGCLDVEGVTEQSSGRWRYK